MPLTAADPVQSLPGIGPAKAQTLAKLHITTLGDLLRQTIEEQPRQWHPMSWLST